MNPKQQKTIERIKKIFLDRCGAGGRYEFKLVNTEVCTGFVMLVLEAGLHNDTGTYAAILCRTRGQFFIGPRGGITCASLTVGIKEVEKKYQGQWFKY